MAGAVGLVGRRDAGGVELMFQQTLDQVGRSCRVVGIVAIDKYIDVGVYVREHAPDHIALTLKIFAADDGAGLLGAFGALVGGIVVVNVDPRIWDRGAEVRHHLGDGLSSL